jgi:SagB-type dehydrogenase family enzyme
LSIPLSNLVSGNLSLTEALEIADSIRTPKRKKLSLGELGRVLWATQGVTKRDSGWIYPLRSAPSAGGLYPLEVYVVVDPKGVDGLSEGVYHYDPVGERLTLFKSGDYFAEVSKIMGFLHDEYSLYLLICAVYARTTSKYGERGIMYVHNEVGHAALNAIVECASLNLLCEPVVIRSTSAVKAMLGLDEEPLLLLKVSGAV